MHPDVFPALPQLPASCFRRRHPPSRPVVYRNLAAHWPAVRRWSFVQLAHAVPDIGVQLVRGNREMEDTVFQASTLRRYLMDLDAGRAGDGRPSALKEFDLLAHHPVLRDDLLHDELLPRSAVRSLRAWIGPAGANTGLHFDRLDNIAVQVIGTKQWRLVRPGLVEELSAASSKYDAWAVLARTDARTLAQRQGSTCGFFEAQLHAGDVLYVPAGWWHEVENLTPTLMFGGFHGSLARVLPRWLAVAAKDLLHRAGGWSRGHCTCHPAAPAPARRPAASPDGRPGLARIGAR